MSNSHQIAQPSRVATAVKLLYATLGIGIIRSIFLLSRHAESISFGAVLLTTIAVFGSMWLLIYMIGKGINWARITYCVLFILCNPFSVLPIIQTPTHEPTFGVLGFALVIHNDLNNCV